LEGTSLPSHAILSYGMRSERKRVKQKRLRAKGAPLSRGGKLCGQKEGKGGIVWRISVWEDVLSLSRRGRRGEGRLWEGVGGGEGDLWGEGGNAPPKGKKGGDARPLVFPRAFTKTGNAKLARKRNTARKRNLWVWGGGGGFL